MPITKRDVDNLLPHTTLWDDGRGSVAGFGVRRQATRPTFVLKVRIGTRQRWLTIGKFGSPWTVETAREQAKVLLGQIAQGDDPSAAKNQSSAAMMTISELCDLYINAARKGLVITRRKRPKASSTIENDAGRIEAHVRPLVGHLRVVETTRADIQKMVDQITVGKTANDKVTGYRGRSIVRGGAAQAGRVVDMLSGIFTWAEGRELVSGNPTKRVVRFIPQPRDRFLNRAEFAALGNALSCGAPTKGSPFNPMAIQIVWLLALTGCRTNEIAALRWDEIDFDAQCLRLQATKTGKSIRPIGKAALDRLLQLPRLASSPFVFPASRGAEGPYQGTKREGSRIFAAANLVDVTCHTLRHSFATMAAELEYSEFTIAGLLGHSTRGVTARYAHRPDSSVIAAANIVSEAIAKEMGISFHEA